MYICVCVCVCVCMCVCVCVCIYIYIYTYMHTLLTQWKINCNHQQLKITFFFQVGLHRPLCSLVFDLAGRPVYSLLQVKNRFSTLPELVFQCRDAGRICLILIPTCQVLLLKCRVQHLASSITQPVYWDCHTSVIIIAVKTLCKWVGGAPAIFRIGGWGWVRPAVFIER